MKFFQIKTQDLKLLLIISLVIINLIPKILLTESSNSIKLNKKTKSSLSQIQKFKFYFMLKLSSVKEDARHPLNTFSYKNVLLSTSQVVYFVSSNPNNSVRLLFMNCLKFKTKHLFCD